MKDFLSKGMNIKMGIEQLRNKSNQPLNHDFFERFETTT